MDSQHPALPLEDLHAAAGDHPESQAAVADFHTALTAEKPDAATVAAHADRVRALPNLVGTFERWYLDPKVQAFIAELNATGI